MLQILQELQCLVENHKYPVFLIHTCPHPNLPLKSDCYSYYKHSFYSSHLGHKLKYTWNLKQKSFSPFYLGQSRTTVHSKDTVEVTRKIANVWLKGRRRYRAYHQNSSWPTVATVKSYTLGVNIFYETHRVIGHWRIFSPTVSYFDLCICSECTGLTFIILCKNVWIGWTQFPLLMLMCPCFLLNPESAIESFLYLKKAEH